MTTITREGALAEREALAAESALAYRLRHDVTDPLAARLGGSDAAALERVAAYLRERETATREASDALSEVLGLERLRK
jgi:hypothetical protein